MRYSRLSVLALPLCVLIGCSSEQKKAPVIAEAFVGPSTLQLRKELRPGPLDGAKVKHGEVVEIVQRRRRFLKIRTPSGEEGWTDMRQLLSSADMDALNGLAGRAAKLPPQGAATSYDALNVHTDPNRLSPSFHRMHEGELADVVEHVLAPRGPYEPKGEIIPPPPPKKKVVRKPKERKESEVPRPTPPSAPEPPEDWLEMSQTPIDLASEEEKDPEPPAPLPTEDWSLIRLSDGRAGWVLSRMLRMQIPDEVAQYSEGQRITSYFSTGKVAEENGEIKHNWLWTTISVNNVPYEFDSFRYFIWNRRKNRYETAYVERNLKGFYPVTVHPVKVTMNKKEETMPGFSLIVEEKDGRRYRRTYAYQIYLVRLVSRTPWEPADAGREDLRMASNQVGVPANGSEPTLYERLKRNVNRLLRR